jgi:hypothetical protein
VGQVPPLGDYLGDEEPLIHVGLGDPCPELVARFFVTIRSHDASLLSGTGARLMGRDNARR